MKGKNKVKCGNVATDEKPSDTQVMDEKRAAESQIKLELPGMVKLKISDKHRFKKRCFLLLSSILHLIIFTLSLFLDIQRVAISANLSAYFQIRGYKELLAERHILLKDFLLSYTLSIVGNTVLAGYGMYVLWSPAFCGKVTSCFSYQQCQDNIGFLRAMGTTLLIGHVVFEACLLYAFRKIYEYDEMIKNHKKDEDN